MSINKMPHKSDGGDRPLDNQMLWFHPQIN